MFKLKGIKWQLVIYDIIASLIIHSLVLWIDVFDYSIAYFLEHFAFTFVPIMIVRILFNVYGQIWRYGGVKNYVTLMLSDICACIISIVLVVALKLSDIGVIYLLCVFGINLVCAIFMRALYQFAYQYSNNWTKSGRFLSFMLRMFSGIRRKNNTKVSSKIKIAVIGAGRLGATLVEELHESTDALYIPCCIVDIDKEKAGRQMRGVPVMLYTEKVFNLFEDYGVQEVVIAITDIEDEKKKALYKTYSSRGYKVRTYDYPSTQTTNGKRHLRDFDIQELLFRKPIEISNVKTFEYYKDKVVMVTGGGGSIGSELCRQLAKMQPKKIIVLDVCENGAYEIQQEIKMAYGDKIDLVVEIVSIVNKKGLKRVFELHHPQIIINAAAHKHVPLMESNCAEAVENNVFGAKNLIDLCEEYNAERFMMISTDKAVNPTNVMGATKRFCEMLVQCASQYGKVKYSSTRFGNVLGSAGSVIPLFRMQIANGGPITITDKRIIRYFMTITEASQLVLESGAMAKNGELFVLDMGQPVKIYDLAANMIRLSGVNGIKIIETGLRPGEKLYEELLVKSENLTKTENDLIFIEKDKAPCEHDVDLKLALLKSACDSQNNEQIKAILKQVIPTYKSPEEVNCIAEQSAEMKLSQTTKDVSDESKQA